MKNVLMMGVVVGLALTQGASADYRQNDSFRDRNYQNYQPSSVTVEREGYYRQNQNMEETIPTESPRRLDKSDTLYRDTNGGYRDLNPSSYSSSFNSAESESDRLLQERIKTALSKDGALSQAKQRVQIAVKNGYVILRGNVATQAEKSKVETLVKQQSGVSSIDNQITVESAKAYRP